jgi:hypothetical protein
MRRPIRQLLWACGLRDFGDGFVAVLLSVYLTADRSLALSLPCLA